MKDCKEKEPCRYYWTLPVGAIPYRGAYTTIDQNNEPVFTGNGGIFEGRHSYALSTPSYRGDLDWLVVLKRQGWWIPQFVGSDDILSERGVFDIGSDVVMIKPSMRQLILNVRFTGDNRDDWEEIRQQFAYIFSWEHATAVNTDEPDRHPSAFDKPNPFTITYECYDANGYPIRKHADVAVAWLSNDDDNGDINDGLEANIIMVMSDPRFYSDEIQYTIEGIPDNLPDPDTDAPPTSLLVSPGSPGVPIGTFRYMGSARSGFDLKFRIDPNSGGNEQIHLKEIVLYDETIGQFTRFPYWDYPDRGWNDFPASVDSSEYEFSSEGRFFRRMDLATATTVLEDNLHNYVYVPSFSDWSAMWMIPGHVYSLRMVAEGNDDELAVVSNGTFTYRERFSGV